MILAQQKLRTNQIFVFKAKSNTKFEFTAEVRSVHRFKWRSTSTLRIGIFGSKAIFVNVPFVLKTSTSPLNIPLNKFEEILREGTASRAFKWVSVNCGNENKSYLQKIFGSEVLPHIGMDHSERTRRKKLLFLGEMIDKLKQVFYGILPPDDRDSQTSKKVDGTGTLLAILFRQL